MPNDEVTTNEIMEFLRDHMVMRTEFEETKGDIKKLRDDFRVDLHKQKWDILDAIDTKLTNLKGDLIVLMRGEDKKVSDLITLLKEKKVITKEEAGILLALQPFPQLQGSG